MICKIDTSTLEQIEEHLNECSKNFTPPLSSYVNIKEYSNKIYNKSTRLEVFEGDKLVGLIACYSNNEEYVWVTNVSTTTPGKGVAEHLLKILFKNTHKSIKLEVNKNNERAIKFYSKNKFTQIEEKPNVFVMEHKVRNYNEELKDTSDHKYNYDFDFDIIHGYMIKSFESFFKEGSILELGSFKGDFTKRLLPYSDEITCVEASDEAIKIAKDKLKDCNVLFINSLFETVNLPKKYDNIVLTHVLEHIDDSVGLLKRINDEWLADGGRLFLVCPNANAPSRQIAVKMGLISHNSAITSAEKEHGHNITYTLDTLERDVKLGGLKVEYRSGIFFKALANFQWDQLLQTDIISKEYLDGCYELGQQYPDLCSSIMLICKKG